MRHHAEGAQRGGDYEIVIGRRHGSTAFRRTFAMVCAILAFSTVEGRAAAPGAPFSTLMATLWPAAQAQGIPRAVFDAAFAGLVPDPTVASLTRRQPEFAKPIGAYLASQVTAGRIAAGQAALARWHESLAAIENRFGVPPAIVVAVWGLETNYGASPGNKDVIRSLATLAAMDWRPDLTRAELLAALTMLKDGDVPREKLRGSWAGAMGQPQFMPSSFEKYAVDQDGDGRRDIWGSVPDALASIANFLRQQGWQPGLPWGVEVRLPPGLDLARSHGSFTDWTAHGVTRPDGEAFPARGDATLFFPAGAAGPAFLVTDNYPVLKTYNFSDAYVLSVATLADRMQGGPAVAAAWPNAAGMSRESRIALQAKLAALGLPVDNREGRVSLELRDTIRLAQARVGLVPDGNPSDELLRALQSALP
ncbi:lytic murein transglycosylase [Lichenifustis flavocetrariae]|uniref:Lytic murein transglycosylase n=1 Tax=Lichenifustis flavocetrariae TaxID=2949735 RepID=A0AA41YX70_9HYPH|nr:lytic murein transglycosylase [Lichenifustis flavocetrariae]MCW6508653.1 lytic murein transglycosylase [Lichenifustis flavocetrariae]